MKPRVLLLSRVYLPGHLAGGPVRSIANMVDWLGDEYDYWIITSDRDLNSPTPYEGVATNVWLQVGKAHVMYLRPSRFAWWRVLRLVRRNGWDVVYTNSFFSPLFSLVPLLAIWSGGISVGKLVVAPRGEFSAAAYRIKRWKKRPLVALLGLVGALVRPRWHASTEFEAANIVEALGVPQSSIAIARNLSPRLVVDEIVLARNDQPRKQFEICFISRITRMKNLDFALHTMSTLTLPLRFRIYGPIEDIDYWRECEEIIATLPANVEVSYEGPLKYECVRAAIARHDLFFLPSRGENFGHVFIEAWSVGVPVLTSDQTPWRELASKQVGWDISLKQPELFREKIYLWSATSVSTVQLWAQRCTQFAREISNDLDDVEAHRLLFPVSRSSI